jgi:hypothetical protein
MTRRTNRARAFAPDPEAPGRCCDMPGCTKEGGYRAPRSRSSLREYYWFCLDHVREYNATWDYYKGMSPAEIERETRADTGWQRPTWKLGQLGAHAPEEELFHDRLDVLGAAGMARRGAQQAGPPPPLKQPLTVLGLPWPVSLEDVKARYKELAKRHHPDANGGDRAAEERLKDINLAYAAIRSHLVPGVAVPAG